MSLFFSLSSIVEYFLWLMILSLFVEDCLVAVCIMVLFFNHLLNFYQDDIC